MPGAARRWPSAGARIAMLLIAPVTARSDGLPTFPALANRAGMTDATLKGAMTALHSRMPDFELGARDQNDLAAYILSLKAK
jgi:hypothetical protein